MHLKGHSKQKYITGRCLQTSKQKNWNSLLAERWTHHAGRLRDGKPEETEIAIMLSGNLRVKRHGDSKFQETHAVPGTIWLCPAGIDESNITLYGNMEDCIHLFIPSKPLSDSSLMDFDIDPDSITIKYEGGFQDEFLKQIGIMIAHEMTQSHITSNLLIDNLRNTLAAHLIHNYSNISNPKQIKYPTGGLDPVKLAKIEEYIASNLYRNISLAELADLACLSPYHFSRLFKRTTGFSPHKFVLGKKLCLAKNLLDQNKSISEVAFLCGFSSQSHFSIAFKQATSLTPKKYYTLHHNRY